MNHAELIAECLANGARRPDYLAYCDICKECETFDNADHARSYGWGIYNGQQFCPEHHAED